MPPEQNQNQGQSSQVPPTPPVPPVSGENNDKNMAMIGYILFFVPLLAVKNRSSFLNYHVNQGLGLFIVALVGSVALNAIFGWRFYMISNIWNLLMIILAVLGIVNVSKNETKPLPAIGNWFHLIK